MEKEFIFYNRADQLYSTVVDVMAHIHTVSGTTSQKITSRCSVILTELLTNAIKHGGDASSRLKVQKHDQSLYIIKTDLNSVFLPIPSPGAHERSEKGEKILLTSDPLSDLYAIVEDTYRYKFDIQDHPMTDNFLVHNLLEHYGLQLITRAADLFYYEHYPHQQQNVFTAVILL